MSNERYWQVWDVHEQLKAAKQQLLNGFDPQTNSRVTRDDPFDGGAQLTVTLTVNRNSASSSPATLGTEVGGRDATSTGADTFTVDSTGLTDAGAGLGLDVYAR